MQVPPPLWTAEELDRDRLIAIEDFRNSRLAEGIDQSTRAHDRYVQVFRHLFEATDNLRHLERIDLEALGSREVIDAIRYIAAPPISEDDLKVLADVSSLALGKLASDPVLRSRVFQTIREALDPRRFPWLAAGRQPEANELHAAIVASAALVAAQRVATKRRSQSKNEQEELVRLRLLAAGFEQVAAAPIQALGNAPSPGQFCTECLVGSRQADLVLSTYDHRMVAIECKVSNSSTNSIKRLNNDAAVKAEVWRKDFGERHIVPVALVSGVYKLHNLIEAQDRGLIIVWAHNLDPMCDWLEKTRA